MRIAYISADLGVPVFGTKGCSLHVQEILRALIECGAGVELFTPRGEGQAPAGLEAVRVHALPLPPKSDPATREQAARAANAALTSELRSAAPFDLIYERYSLWSYAAMEYARHRGTPGLLEVNAPLIEEQAQYRVLIDRVGAEHAATRAFTAARFLLAVSSEVADYLRSFPSAQGKVHIVPNAVRPERFPEPAASARDPGTYTVGFLGTLKAWHGLGILVEAFARLHQQHSNARLLIVGDGPERETVEAALATRGLTGAARLTGAVPPNEVPALLACMDVAVAPYPKLEKFYFSPLKVYEYMAAGLPVVASGLGQLRDLITPEVNGLLVPPGDAEALASALARLAGQSELRRRLGQSARALVLRNYTWDAVAAQILRLGGLATPDHARPAIA